MTSKYVFVGSRAEILGPPSITLDHFGQEVSLDPAVAEKLIRENHVPLVPADKFAKATAGAADPELAARIALHEHREAAPESPAQSPAEIPSEESK
jgi:hypothetical protein